MKISLSRTKFYWLLAIIILGSAILLRFLDLPDRVIFTEDHSLFNIFAYKNIVYHENLQVGPSIGGVWATFPPTFYYLTTFLIKISNFNYYVLHIMTGFANVLALLLILIFFPKIIGKRMTIATVIIYGLSFIVVSQSIVGTNPGLLPPLTILLFLALIWTLRDKKLWALPVVALVISVMTHLHVTPFFLIPGIGILFLLYFREFNYRLLPYLVVCGLIIIYVGVRPHYLQNKAFGGENARRVIAAVTQGVGKTEVAKAQSAANFLTGLSDLNVELLFPTVPARLPGLFLSFILISVAILGIVKTKKPTAQNIVSVLFLSYVVWQAVVPTYPVYEKPVRWLDGVYFPLLIIFLGIIVSKLTVSKQLRPLVTVAGFIFLVLNLTLWNSNKSLGDRTKLKTVITAAGAVVPLAEKENNINLVHIGNVNLNPTWPFAFALWKETGDQKYLRTLLWNIDPKRNEPFYIFSDGKDASLENSEKLAKSFQDNPQSLVIDIKDGFLVEKIFNNSSASPAGEQVPNK